MNMGEHMVAKHVIVTGKVQGVWFRAWTKEQADARGLAGWVRNCPDGSVEAVLSGKDAAVEELIDALHHGPRAAHVTDVRVAETDAPADSGFQIRD
jgi:acylphosphatase